MMRLSAIALWTRGHLVGADVDVMRVTIDTRKLQAGDLFVAIKGERVDGHEACLGETTGAAQPVNEPRARFRDRP